MKALLLALALLTSAGCASTSTREHQAHVDALRARLPYVCRISFSSHSMTTVLESNELHMVEAKPYGKLQSGDIVIFWPMGHTFSICHFVGHRLGTDSWTTYSMATYDDLQQQGFMLTRENYIGVILK